jgi:glycyl-tRNA synthetase beta chain
MSNLLIELLVEELPPKALDRLSKFFSISILKSLTIYGLVNDETAYKGFATPRRLGIWIEGVRSQAPDKMVVDKLVPEKIAFNEDGTPSTALSKKLAKLALSEPGTEAFNTALTQTTIQDGFVQFSAKLPGRSLTEAVNAALDKVIDEFPSPKRMSYQLKDGFTTKHFVRPVHGLLVLHGADTLENVTVLGLTAGNTTQGHRFEAKQAVITIQDADSYESQLAAEGAVIASYAARRTLIASQLAAAAAQAGSGLRAIDDADLLDEVNSLVERPNVVTCEFEREFLDVPQECLILTMKANQKYFPLLDCQGKLSNKFLVVSNITPSDASAVIQGNERVVRPRLADAKFFFDQDRKKTLASRVDGLSKIVYHNKLGTQGERTERVAAIAALIVKQLREATHPYSAADKDHFDVLASKVAEAARLAKTDLVTDMVGEFPELQGIMGGYYARHDGLRDGVAIAIEDHYKPRFAGDALPRNTTGTVVALADKLETLVGMFGIGNLPTGDKDPFALRRHALGVIRMLVEKNLVIDLPELIQHAAVCFGDKLADDTRKEQTALLTFINERFATNLREQNYSAQEVDAVLSMQITRFGDVPKRLEAVRAFAALPESAALAAANKRVSNILKKSDAVIEAKVDESVLVEVAEKALHTALATIKPIADAAYEQGDYAGSLKSLAALKAPVDSFFESVMVNAENPALKANRLGLLATLHAAMNRVADLSKLAS